MNNNTIAAKLMQLKQIEEQKRSAAENLHAAKVALAELLVDEAKGVKDLLPEVDMICGAVTEDGVDSPVRFTVSIAKVGDPAVGESRSLQACMTDQLGGFIENPYDHNTRCRHVEPGEWFDALAEELWRLASQEDQPSRW